VWLEEAATGELAWRGHVTHVIDRQRRYFENLDDIVGFIARYLLDSELDYPQTRGGGADGQSNGRVG
jgi:hypothetical protein